jgi:aminoglycoside 6'-N-acetyltransferase I
MVDQAAGFRREASMQSRRTAARTVPFDALSDQQRDEAAAILMSALAHVPSAWHDVASARAEVATFFGNPERSAIAALDQGRLIGWIGAIRQSAHAWELHPLVVHPSHQRRHCGTLLVNALEAMAGEAGACTIWLGTDDDFGGTNLFGADLYPQVLERLLRLEPVGTHPYTFFRRMGFVVVGVLPDADGIGRHDILMAKRIAATDC